jgi:anti-sigma factor RsiW
MACEHSQLLVMALVDDALGWVSGWRARWRIARCPSCAAEYDRLLTERAVLRTALPRHRAPPVLAARIGAALVAEPPPPRRRPAPRLVAPFAATALAGALAGAALVLAVPGRAPDPETGLIDAHVRAMMDEHLTDVPTSDRHTVKPWLSARLDVSPPVPDLAAEGFVLIGGRSDVADGHRAAVAVYRRDRHMIDLFAWRDPGPASGFTQRRDRGFNVVEWRKDGIAFHAVSDVEAAQLAAFARLIAEAQ